MTGFSTRCMRPADWKDVKHFAPVEFTQAVPGQPKRRVCAEKMGYEFVLLLDRIREDAGVKMVISSCHRVAEYNQTLSGAAANSSHVRVPCSAVDIRPSPTKDDPNWNAARFKIVEAAIRHGVTRIGFYPNGSLHLDRSDDTHPSPRLWFEVKK